MWARAGWDKCSRCYLAKSGDHSESEGGESLDTFARISEAVPSQFPYRDKQTAYCATQITVPWLIRVLRVREIAGHHYTKAGNPTSDVLNCKESTHGIWGEVLNIQVSIVLPSVLRLDTSLSPPSPISSGAA